MKYFGAKSKITSWSLISCMTLECNIVANMFRKANKTLNLTFSATFNLLTKSASLHQQQGQWLFSGQNFQHIPSFLCVETGLTEYGKKLAEPFNELAMTSSEHWHSYMKLIFANFDNGHLTGCSEVRFRAGEAENSLEVLLDPLPKKEKKKCKRRKIAPFCLWFQKQICAFFLCTTLAI